MRTGLVPALLTVCAALAGCGGKSGPPHRGGSALFAEDCSACHTLSGNDSAHKQGGDLLRYRLSRAEWLQFAAEMPVRRPLAPAQVATVVDYVLAVQQAKRRE